ncbi:alpha/beta hydrolase [Steroidobacter sp.]|uniref:alpha/beta hydrolase n=1 Tax=Steroidobacter sp. TaxID=1978227 RepID=UPI001A54D8A0|nr:alpha/beta hydrolase [Steroidobacter sp.]MBL8266454.1 alpha/beta hydrolase [Steroidobacter sp.]
MKSSGRLILALFALVLPQLTGCTLAKLRSESAQFYDATVLVGRVWGPDNWYGPVIVAATTKHEGRTVIVHRVRLHEPGGYELIVPDGRYTLIAYGDSDGNGLPDDTDPAGLRAEQVRVAANGLITLLDIPLTAEQIGTVRAVLPADSGPAPTHSTQAGAIADLQSPAFATTSGSLGYWTPLEAFRATGGNIYFLEPYDPARTPVLFVHGAVGSAQDWRYFFDRLDRTRYQAWFFQYPSGSSLDSMSHLLYWKLLNLQLRYGFQRLDMVAHSMGGLLTRRFLLDHGAQFPQITRFVTISTPWGGETTATLGVNHSPAVVPSWRDMQPEGAFLKRLFERPLPAGVSYSLLFGHRGGYNLFRPTTDGTVTLASQLRGEAQSSAGFMMGFDEDHTSILSSPAVLAQVTQLLDSGNGTDQAGRLQIDLSFDGEYQTAGGVPALILQRLDGDDAQRQRPSLLPLAATAGSRTIGPIQAGEYEIKLLATGFCSTPDRLVTRIERGEAVPLQFQLTPQGWLSGYIVSATDTLTHPAGSYRAPEPVLPIREIVIEGPSGRRRLVPRPHDDPDSEIAAQLGARDDAVGALFSFVDLAAGEYQLTIVADGYQPHVSRHHVEPGVVLPASPFVLRPIQ